MILRESYLVLIPVSAIIPLLMGDTKTETKVSVNVCATVESLLAYFKDAGKETFLKCFAIPSF